MTTSSYLMKGEGILPTSACIAAGVVFLALAVHSFFFATADELSRGTKVPPPLMDAKRMRPVVVVTIAWSALYYCFLMGQAASVFWVHKILREGGGSKKDESARPLKSISFAEVKYGSQVRQNTGLILTMDRSVGNMLEQTPPFLISLWLHALMASADDAARLGWAWLLLRASYPIAFAHPSMSQALWGVQRSIGISWVSFVTWPSYAIVWSLLMGAGRAAGVDW